MTVFLRVTACVEPTSEWAVHASVPAGAESAAELRQQLATSLASVNGTQVASRVKVEVAAVQPDENELVVDRPACGTLFAGSRSGTMQDPSI